ncbi:hypothetical protein QTH09_16100 [Clostridium perfringens]|nr:hypothetical protein [Clostridium perfringens]
MVEFIHEKNIFNKHIEFKALPNGIIPLYFSSENKANLYFDEIAENLENSE